MSISEKTKKKIISKFKNGSSIKELIKEYNISKISIYAWKSELEPQPLEQAHISIYELKQLKKKIKHYETTIDIYEKTQCTKTSPLSQRLEAMKKVEKEFSHASLCRTLDVKKGTFLNHLYRKVEETQLEKEDKIYNDKLTELFQPHKGRLGLIKSSKIMTQQGF